MLPLFRPILYLPFIGQQTKEDVTSKQVLQVTINDFNNSNNQDKLCDFPLINAETSELHFNLQHKKALMQELV